MIMVLGLGDRRSRNCPTRLLGFNNIIQVSCGEDITGFVTSEGKLYVCGLVNVGDMLLLNSGWPTILPSLKNYHNIIQVSCHNQRMMAFVTDTGECYLDNLDTIDGRHFQKLKVPGYIIQVSCGLDHLACITDTGCCYVWGENYAGQLGIPEIHRTDVPVPLQFYKKIVKVSCGSGYTAFITDDGKLHTFGLFNWEIEEIPTSLDVIDIDVFIEE